MELSDGVIRLRPINSRDRKWWTQIQQENEKWLKPWEATYPDGGERPTYRQMIRAWKKDAKYGRSENYIITKVGSGDGVGERVGFIALGGIAYGPSRSAFIGYWVIERFANQGITTRAVRLVTDHAFDDLRLHRIEINVRPENHPSIRVAMKSGYELEGKRSKYLHIDGAWRDHLCFVATRD